MKNKNIIIIALVTVFILMIPLVAMQFTDEVNWSVFDFMIMGLLLFGTGFMYEFVSSRSKNILYKLAVGIAVITGLLLIWINMAVGLIGSEGTPANLLYIGVLVVGIIGALITRFQPHGMAQTLFITALLQAIVPLIALVFWSSAFDEPPGFAGIFILNSIFALLFAGSALLFRRANNITSSKKELNVQIQ